MAKYALHLVTGGDPVIWEGESDELLDVLRSDFTVLPSGSVVSMRHVVLIEPLP